MKLRFLSFTVGLVGAALVLLPGSASANAPRCYSCVYDGYWYACNFVGYGVAGAWTTCENSSSGCEVGDLCAPYLMGGDGSVVLPKAPELSRRQQSRTVFLTVSHGRRIARGCDGSVTERVYTRNAVATLRKKSEKISI
jgi:hypothetical protein